MIIKPYSRKTHYYETDQMGIIHHANYIHWMEEARVDFMDQIGFSYDRAVSTGIDTSPWSGLVKLLTFRLLFHPCLFLK